MNTITQIKEWPSDAVVESLQGRVRKVYERKTGVGKEGKSSVQNAEIEDAAGNKIRMSVWDHPDLAPLEGTEVVIHSSRGGNNKFGGVAVKHGSYVSRKDGSTVKTVELSVSRLGQFQTVAVYQQNNPNGADSGNVGAQATQAESNGAKSQVNRLHGATVGMAINQACYHLTHTNQPLDPKKVYEIASGLVKVAVHMEAGNLSGATKETKPVEEGDPF